jgi:hypothetical protein
MKIITINVLIFSLFLNFFTPISYSETHPAISNYDKYLQAINNAQTLDDLNPYISKRKIEVYGVMTENKKKSTLAFKKSIAKFTQRKDIKAETVGGNATLTVDIIDTSSNNPVAVIVNLVKEGGEW